MRVLNEHFPSRPWLSKKAVRTWSLNGDALLSIKAVRPGLLLLSAYQANAQWF